MSTELVWSRRRRQDLARLNRQVADRVIDAMVRYADMGAGDVQRLVASDELRLRVGDWRVRFTSRMETRSAEPLGTGEVQVRVIEVLRVLPRGRAYRG